MSLIRLTTRNGNVRTMIRTNSFPMPLLSLAYNEYNCIHMRQIMLTYQRRAQTHFSTSSTERLRRRQASTRPKDANSSRWYFNWRSANHYYQRYYERYKLWAMLLGLLTIGSIIKVIYFKFSRQMIVSDANAKHMKNMEHLQEANAYAQWSEQDRLSKLPSITPEQRQQIQQYLSIIEQHGYSKSVAAHERQQQKGDDGNSNDKCPVLPNSSRNITPSTNTK